MMVTDVTSLNEGCYWVIRYSLHFYEVSNNSKRYFFLFSFKEMKPSTTNTFFIPSYKEAIVIMRVNRVILVVLTLLLVMAPEIFAQEKITLRWTTCCAQPDRHELFQIWARRYEARNPGVKIEWEYPAGSYGPVLTTRIAGGAAPDVMWIGGSYWQLYGGFANLNDFAATNSTLKETMPSSFPLFTMEGVLGAAPYGMNTVLFFINQRILNEVGLPFPRTSWTWDDFIKMGKQLTRDVNGDGIIDRYAFDFRSGGYDQTALAWGSPPYAPDMRKVAFNNPVTSTLMQIFADLMSGAHGSLWAPATTGTYAAQLAGNGAVAMVAGGVWAIPTMRSLEADEWEGIPFPWLEYDGQRYRNNFASGEAWAVSANTKYPEEARKFVAFLLEREQMNEFAQLGAIIPAQASVARAFFTPTSAKPQNMAAFLDALETANPLVQYHPIGNEVLAAIRPVMSQLWAGQLPANTALAQMETIANQMLNEFWAGK
jgi:multiple sugar transport system substrate-binding protein